MHLLSLLRKTLLTGVCAAAALTSASAATLKIGYSDWPGWVAWQVAIDKGWLKDAGSTPISSGSITALHLTHFQPINSMLSWRRMAMHWSRERMGIKGK